MASISLDERDRAELQEILRHGSSARALCRAQALLWVEDGEEVGGVAETLGVTPRTVYYWIARFQQRNAGGILERISDAPRSGRPRTALGVIDPLIDDVIDFDPRDLGYRYTGWTAALLQGYLARFHGIEVSLRSIGAAIARVQARWKRPRHRLALRADTWQQSKGGSKEA